MTTKPGDITKAAIVADSNIDVIQWNQNLNFHAKKAIKTAEEFLPTVPGDWTSAPATQDAALNELGARSAVGAETSTANIFTESQTLANAKALILKELTANGTGQVSVKAPDAINANDAFVQTLQAATGTVALSADVSAVANDVANLVTLSGVAVDAVNLGTFTGSTIADNVVIKAALQSLETSVELKAVKSASSHTVVFARFGAGITAVALVGLLVNDIVILLTPGVGGVAALSVAAVTVADTLPSDPADRDFLVVLRPVV